MRWCIVGNTSQADPNELSLVFTQSWINKAGSELGAGRRSRQGHALGEGGGEMWTQLGRDGVKQAECPTWMCVTHTDRQSALHGCVLPTQTGRVPYMDVYYPHRQAERPTWTGRVPYMDVYYPHRQAECPTWMCTTHTDRQSALHGCVLPTQIGRVPYMDVCYPHRQAECPTWMCVTHTDRENSAQR
ncbi:hypothetical protein Bbelb_119910 [Branchiostoma belcheri]|nr:hypothetical protein Bbelb_119910 [Branchiostoma belcheri]